MRASTTLEARAGWASAALVVALLANTEGVRSQGLPETAGRPSLQNQRFDIDFVVGPVLGSGRMIGLGGAYTALADGIEGAPRTAAAYATRMLYDLDWFEYDLTIDLVPASIRNTDFDANGESGFEYGNFVFFTLGGGLRFGAFGAGFVADFQSYELGEGSTLELTQTHFGVGYGFLDGQLVIGTGLRTAGLSIGQAGSPEPLVDAVGVGPELGVLLALEDKPFRVGIALRTPVVSEPVALPVAAGLTLPEHVRLPWEAQLGLAWQLGLRPLNRRFINPHQEHAALRRQAREDRERRITLQLERERMERAIARVHDTGPPRLSEPDYDTVPRDPDFWQRESRRAADESFQIERQLSERILEREREIRGLSRRYLLVSTELLLIGPTERGVGLESFLSQRQQRSGEHISIGLRGGVEGEPIAGHVKMRAGTYLEPSRFEGVAYRVHGTLGTEIRLFSWDLFGLVDDFALRFGASADVAERYLNVGFGFGMWH
jgi:hypothetical protein